MKKNRKQMEKKTKPVLEGGFRPLPGKQWAPMTVESPEEFPAVCIMAYIWCLLSFTIVCFFNFIGFNFLIY
jgi:hypothetical protein